MGNFIRSTLFFSVFTIFFYVLTIFLWDIAFPQAVKPNINYRIGSYGHMFSRVQELKKLKNVDILVLGSSHAYREFDPRIFKKELSEDIKFFNLGSSSQTPLQTELLLKRYLDKLNPKTVIFEVFPFGFSSDGVESSTDIIANDRNDLNSFIMALKINNIKTWNTLIIGALRDLFNMNSSYKEPRKNEKDTYIPGGYVEKEVSYYKEEKLPEKRWELKEMQVEAFKRCLSMIRAKGAKLILINAPVTFSHYSSHPNQAYFNKRMSNYGTYYDFNEIMSLDNSYFYDSNHLNQNGVELFNRKLIDIIFRQYN